MTPRPPDFAADDCALMAAAGAGDERSFALLVDRHARDLVNFFARMGAADAAEDLAQETFLKLWGARARYRPTARFTTFLYTVARRVFLDLCRAERRRGAFAERLAREIPAVSDGGMEEARRRMDLLAALDGLPPRLKEVLVLSVMQGLPYAEIADILSIPVGTVKSRVFTALGFLRETFRETR
ncbi:MAG: RNA polymerase sigma factor [Kiritimatiellae bacterium]|nr:RNA polymerase sigma factor [Kiritimatiellia bacterium]